MRIRRILAVTVSCLLFYFGFNFRTSAAREDEPLIRSNVAYAL